MLKRWIVAVLCAASASTAYARCSGSDCPGINSPKHDALKRSQSDDLPRPNAVLASEKQNAIPEQPQDRGAKEWAATDRTSVAALEKFIRDFGDTYYGVMALNDLSALKRSQSDLPTSNAARPRPDQQAVGLAVPHIRQEKNLCVPTSAAMVLGFFGDQRSPRELKVLSRGRPYDPSAPFDDFSSTWFKDMVAGMRRIGYVWSVGNFSNDAAGFEKGLAAMELSLDRGNPVLVDTSFVKTEGHTFVVVGVERKAAQLRIIDPDMPAPGVRIMTMKNFEAVWNSTAVGTNIRGAIFTKRKDSATAKAR
jgi:hypothetical protein